MTVFFLYAKNFYSFLSLNILRNLVMSNEIETNVSAKAVNLIEWMSGDTIFAIPAYQRNYRWDKTNCQALLDSIITANYGQSHFIGSILSTENGIERTLVDGQQRLITVSLLLAALLHSENVPDKEQIEKILIRQGEMKVRPFIEREPIMKAIVFEKETSETESQFYKNFEYFKKAVKNNPTDIWNGLKKLECVDIKINDGKTAQQVFESLNSTGKPLDDAELINNYILIGYERNIQDDIEIKYWIDHFEKNTTKDDEVHLNDFFRHYLSLETGKKVEEKKQDEEHNVFITFKEFFKGNNIDLKNETTLRQWCEKWKDLSACFYMLLNPLTVSDEDVQEYLITLTSFGESVYPFLMAVLNDYMKNKLDLSILMQILQLLESFYFRNAVCGINYKKIDMRMAALYNNLDKTNPQRYFDTLSQKLFLDTPSDDLVRQALWTECKSRGTEILIKLDKKINTHKKVEKIIEKQRESNEGIGIELEHIFPQHPENNWNNGERPCTDDEIKQMLLLLNNIGNWAPLEKKLNINASNHSFPDKKKFYKESSFEMVNKELFDIKIWDVKAIEARAERLTNAFLDKWKMPSVPDHENDSALIPILEVPFRGIADLYSELKYSQAEFQGNSFQVTNIKELYTIIIQELWKKNKEKLLTANDRLEKGWQPIKKEPTSIQLDAEHYLYIKMWHCWQLQLLRTLLAEMNLADELFVKYAKED